MTRIPVFSLWLSLAFFSCSNPFLREPAATGLNLHLSIPVQGASGVEAARVLFADAGFVTVAAYTNGSLVAYDSTSTTGTTAEIQLDGIPVGPVTLKVRAYDTEGGTLVYYQDLETDMGATTTSLTVNLVPAVNVDMNDSDDLLNQVVPAGKSLSFRLSAPQDFGAQDYYLTLYGMGTAPAGIHYVVQDTKGQDLGLTIDGSETMELLTSGADATRVFYLTVYNSTTTSYTLSEVFFRNALF